MLAFFTVLKSCKFSTSSHCPLQASKQSASFMLGSFFLIELMSTFRGHVVKTKSFHFLQFHLGFLAYTGCPGGNVPAFGRMFLTLKYTELTQKHLYPKLNGYGDNGESNVWSSCGSTYCTCFACCYPYTAHVCPSVSQPSQAHSAFIINRRHSYSEL